jgi:hypothetical protein
MSLGGSWLSFRFRKGIETMVLVRLILGGLAGMAGGIVMFVAGLQQPDDFGEFVWLGPIMFALGMALAGYGLWKGWQNL